MEEGGSNFYDLLKRIVRRTLSTSPTPFYFGTINDPKLVV